jgi:hypothetical protein
LKPGCGENQLGPLEDDEDDEDDEDEEVPLEPSFPESEGSRLGSDGSEMPGMDELVATR